MGTTGNAPTRCEWDEWCAWGGTYTSPQEMCTEAPTYANRWMYTSEVEWVQTVHLCQTHQSAAFRQVAGDMAQDPDFGPERWEVTQIR